MTKATLYIGIVLLFRVVQAIFNKQSSNEVGNVRTLMVYSTYRMAISAALGLVLLLIAGNGFRFDPMTVLIATFSGVMLFLSGACSIFLHEKRDRQSGFHVRNCGNADPDDRRHLSL